MKGKITFWICFVIVVAGFFFLIDKIGKEEFKSIKSNYGITKGMVIKKSTYKGRSIRVRYIVKNKIYIGSNSFSTNDKVEVGDSVRIMYSLENPELLISEFNEGFDHSLNECPMLNAFAPDLLYATKPNP